MILFTRCLQKKKNYKFKINRCIFFSTVVQHIAQKTKKQNSKIFFHLFKEILANQLSLN